MEEESLAQKVWSKVETYNIVHLLKNAVGERWDIDIHFTDPRGWLQGVSPGKFFTPRNAVLEAISNVQQGYQDRKETAMMVTASSSKRKDPTVTQCKTGFTVVAFPVSVDEEYVGCVYADGFIMEDTATEQSIKMKSYLKQTVDDNPQLLEQVDKITRLCQKDLDFLSAIVQAIADEVVQSQVAQKTAKKKIGELSDDILGNEHSFKRMVGTSPSMKEIYVILEKVKDSSASILITGENGTGKEMIANQLHFASKRAKNDFVALNCGAFNEHLLSSELFGHVKGSFTGASTNKKGLFEVAKNGTIFLDEVGEMPLPMQVKLLRVLQEGTFMPVGDTKERKTNARVVCATNRDLKKMIKKGQFRQDLFYRLDVINVRVPSLRQRREDIPDLAKHFLKKHTTENGPQEIDAKAMDTLSLYSWPGNVRQLENEVQRLCVLVSKPIIEMEDVDQTIQKEVNRSTRIFKVKGDLKKSIEENEKRQILAGSTLR